MVQMRRFRGKTPQSGYETKKNHFTIVQKLGDGFQEKLKASQSVSTGFYSSQGGRGEAIVQGETMTQGEAIYRARQYTIPGHKASREKQGSL